MFRTNYVKFICFAMLAFIVPGRYLCAYGLDEVRYNGFKGVNVDASTWLFCGLEEVDAKDVRAGFDSSVYRESVGDVTDFFKIRNDSIVWSGYNVGRRLGIVAECPASVCAGSENNSSFTEYVATGILDGAFEIVENGTFEYKILKSGNVIIAPSDTLKNVVLSQTVQQKIYPATDSIPADTVSIETYRWNLPNSVVPIAIQRDGVLYVTSNTDIAMEDDFDNDVDAEHLKAILSSANIEVGDGQVCISLTESMSVNVYIMDGAGNIYSSTESEASTFSLDISGLTHNVYILSIVSRDYPEVVHKSIINL